jgi:hypothetical protein
VGAITTFWDEPNKRIIVSDEGYWGANSPTGEKLKIAVKWARDQGYKAGVVLTPYASNRFGDGVTTTAGGHTRVIPGATDQQLQDYIDAADFVVTDPYAVSKETSTPEILNNFASFTKNVGDYANSKGKDSWLILQGFGPKDVDNKVIENYNNRLATENATRYNEMSFFNLSDFGHEGNPTEDSSPFTQLNTKTTIDTVAGTTPAAITNTASTIDVANTSGVGSTGIGVGGANIALTEDNFDQINAYNNRDQNKNDAINKMRDNILAQGTTDKWTTGKGLSKEQTAWYMAERLYLKGVTRLEDFGQRDGIKEVTVLPGHLESRVIGYDE